MPMAQLKLYLPAGFERKIRAEARHSRKSLSAYVVDLLIGRIERQSWNKDFFGKVVGGWKGDFPEIPRESPERTAPS
jgi:hypothetical protein